MTDTYVMELLNSGGVARTAIVLGMFGVVWYVRNMSKVKEEERIYDNKVREEQRLDNKRRDEEQHTASLKQSEAITTSVRQQNEVWGVVKDLIESLNNKVNGIDVDLGNVHSKLKEISDKLNEPSITTFSPEDIKIRNDIMSYLKDFDIRLKRMEENQIRNAMMVSKLAKEDK